MNDDNLNRELTDLIDLACNLCGLKITQFGHELEGKEYKACQFLLNQRKVISRTAKITPKKIGQFVTFWKRGPSGETEPFHEEDKIDFFLINVSNANRIGQFIFPKSVLIKHKILSSLNQEGKRGFRVYPIWDMPKSKQAVKTQSWQIQYFIEYNQSTEIDHLKKLYHV